MLREFSTPQNDAKSKWPYSPSHSPPPSPPTCHYVYNVVATNNYGCMRKLSIVGIQPVYIAGKQLAQFIKNMQLMQNKLKQVHNVVSAQSFTSALFSNKIAPIGLALRSNLRDLVCPLLIRSTSARDRHFLRFVAVYFQRCNAIWQPATMAIKMSPWHCAH